METRSRKRAEASSAAPSTPSSSSSSSSSRPSKRLRFLPPPLPSVTTRSRAASTSASAAPMDSSSDLPPTRRRAPARSHHCDSSSSKGKEREPAEPSSRARAVERIFDLSFDGGGGVDDDDSDGAIGILHQNLTSASSALQGLLRKLGAGLDDLLPSSAISGSSSSQQNGRLKKILSGLRADGEEGKQVEALTQLCEMLSIGTEDSLGSFSVDSFVPVLVGLLNHESNPDIMLLAARALTHLCDVLPSSCAAVVHYGAVPCFCARLLTIEYMDLAEQSLQALKKISQEHPTACLRAGALMAVLSYLDFFSTGVQRVALSTAANMCKKLPSDAADFVMEGVPLLTNLLHYHDLKVLEHASVCLTRISEAFASSPEKLDELCNHGLVAQVAGLISVSSAGGGQASLSTSAYTGLIRLLSTCASGSPLGAKTLLLLGISGTLKDILSGSGLVANISVSPALMRPPEQIYEIVNLADELLPPLPQGTISFPICANILVKGSAVKRSASGTSSKSELVGGKSNEGLAREKLLHDHPEVLQQFGMDLLPVLIQIYGSSVNGPVRHKCLSVIGKLTYFSTANMIESLLTATNISSFLAGVLAWKDPQVLVPALQIAEILMDKLPGTFSKMFVREGVVHAVDLLIGAELANTVPSQASPSERDNDSTIMGTSSRSRHSCLVSGSTNTESSLMDEPKADASGSMGAPPTAEVPSSSSSLRATVSSCARNFKDKYFPADGSAEVGVTEDLLRLKYLCAELNSNVEDVKAKAKGKSKASVACSFDISVNNEEHFRGVVLEMLSDLCKGDGISTFEFIGCGVVLGLLNYFTCGTFANEKISEVDLPKLRDRALQRYKSFIATALPASVGDGSEAPMTVLVKKLQDALSSVERFPVVLSHSSRSSSGSARLSSGLSALSQPLKLRLSREQSDKSLRDYSSNIVLIDPLATLAVVEEFLWPRVQRSEPEQKPSGLPGNSDAGTATDGAVASPTSTFTPASGRRPTTRSRSSLIISGAAQKDPHEGKVSSSKGKGKAILKTNNDEPKGPQTRNSTRRKAELVKDTKAKPAKGESTSEDEELDVSPTEMDDALVIEEDDLSEDEDVDHVEMLRDESLPVCVPEKVHDVKLGDSADDATVLSSASDNQPQPSSGSSNKPPSVRGTDYEFRSGNAFGTRCAMSFAAAAMAGIASVSGRGIRVGRDHHGIPLGANANNYNKLIFTAGGKQLGKHLTVYQAFQRQLMLDEDDDDRYNSSNLMSSNGGRLWGDIFTITYQRAHPQVDASTAGGSDSLSSGPSKSASACTNSSDNQQQMSLLDSILQGELPCDLEKSNPTYNILALLRVLEGLNHLAPRIRAQAVYDDFAEGEVSTLHDLKSGGKVPQDEFVNNKLTPKLARQLQDALALCSGSLPSWCYQMTKACPFLFPFEIRRQYFNSTAFGLSRALHQLQQQQGSDNFSANEREFRVGRLQRQKVRVSRNRILDSAVKVMEIYSSHKAVLEVEYFGEVGTGLGPTLEFYTLLSHDLQKVELGLWRFDGSSDNSAMQIDGDELKDEKRDLGAKIPGSDKGIGSNNHIKAPLGLFPCPWPPNVDVSGGSQFSKVIEYFRLLGRIMAKALQDRRLLDLPLSMAFYKLVLGQELDLHDILSFDPEFGKILEEMQILVRRKQYLEALPGNNQKAIADLRFRGAAIEDLCLDFTLPGYPDYILKKEDTVVNIHNLEEYIQLVVDATTRTGIMQQLEALWLGFNQVFDISSLQIFSPQELDYLLCGRRELWEPEKLVDHVKFDHGYTAKSPAILNLLEIMGEFSAEQQHAFCRFVTGAPRLPPGGLAALNPKLTIVRKHSSAVSNATLNGSGASESVDDDLPSVMTCANYLKLPPYSTKEIMSKKLLYAISEGQGSFDLS